MKINRLFSLALAIFLLLPAMAFLPEDEEESECKTVVNGMLQSIRDANTLELLMQNRERAEGEYTSQKMYAKLQVAPVKKVYVKIQPPETEREILWVENERDGDALINPASFPYFNLTLDPLGRFMRGNRHHSIHDAGFMLFQHIIQNAVNKTGEDFENYFSLKEDTLWNKKECYHVEIFNYDFEWKSYTAKKGENLYDLAKKFSINEYMVLEKNKDIDDYFDVKEGQKLLIPSDYGKRVVMLIDKNQMLPIFFQVFDEAGLFEQYAYMKVIVNPKLTDEDFSSSNENYGF